MKNIVIDGNEFSDLEGFYTEMDKLLTKDLGYNATKNYYQDILKKCHPSNRENVEKKLQEVEKCKGKTILDIIVDIILDTDDSGHWCELETEE